MADVTWAFGRALQDIEDKRRGNRSIIVLPSTSLVGLTRQDAMLQHWSYEREALGMIIKDVLTIAVIVVAARKSGARTKRIDTLPTLWVEENLIGMDSPSAAFMTASSVTRSGSLSSFTQTIYDSHFPSLFAPGEKIKCAGPRGFQTASGTLFAAPIVRRKAKQLSAAFTDNSKGCRSCCVFLEVHEFRLQKGDQYMGCKQHALYD